MIKLGHGECIFTAFAEPCSGPGWANTPIVVIIRKTGGKLREVWLQPEEQTERMNILYNVSATATAAMVRAVEKVLEKR